MLQQLRLDLKVHYDILLASLAAELGGFLFGFILVNIIMRVDSDPGSWFCMGSLMALIVGVAVPLFSGAFSYSSQFQLALSMGRTRSAFMGSFVLRLLLQLLAGYALVLGLYQVELALYPLLFPAYENEVAFTFLTNWRIIVSAIAALLILSMFIGALFGRYGKKSIWVFYLIWLFCCFVLPRMFDDDRGEGVLDQAATGVLRAFQVVPLTAWIVVGAVLAVGMVTTIIVLGRKQMVKL